MMIYKFHKYLASICVLLLCLPIGDAILEADISEGTTNATYNFNPTFTTLYGVQNGTDVWFTRINDTGNLILGSQCSTSADYSIVGGLGSNVTLNTGVAYGFYNLAEAGAVALGGQSNEASGLYSFAFGGTGNKIKGSYASGSGQNNRVSGTSAFSVGKNNYILGTASAGIGEEVNTTANNAIALGKLISCGKTEGICMGGDVYIGKDKINISRSGHINATIYRGTDIHINNTLISTDSLNSHVRIGDDTLFTDGVSSLVGIGTDTPINDLTVQFSGGGLARGIAVIHNSAGTGASPIWFMKSTGTGDIPAKVGNNDVIGSFYSRPHDGIDYNTVTAGFQFQVNGSTPSTDYVPTDMVFFTDPTLATNSFRMILTASGNLGLNVSHPNHLFELANKKINMSRTGDINGTKIYVDQGNMNNLIVTGNITGNYYDMDIQYHNDTDNGYVVNIATQDKWYNVTAFNQTSAVDYNSNGWVFNATTNAFQCEFTGRYHMEHSESIGNSGVNQNYHFALSTNGTARNIHNNTETHRKVGVAGDQGNSGDEGIINCYKGDYITIMVRNSDGTADPYIYGIGVTIMYRGNTW